MGARQALQWGCLYPQRVGRMVALCGVPRTTSHNRLLLEAMAHALSGQDHEDDAAVAFAARIYAAWSLSHEFFADTMAAPLQPQRRRMGRAPSGQRIPGLPQAGPADAGADLADSR